MEEEARKILANANANAIRNAQHPATTLPLGSRIQQLFAGLGEIEIPPRHKARPAPSFGVKTRNRNYQLATQNVTDFAGIKGLDIINPWSAGA